MDKGSGVHAGSADAPLERRLQFYVTPRQRLSPGSILLAAILASVGLLAGRAALLHRHAGRFGQQGSEGHFGAGAADGGGQDYADGDDDPSKLDTIYLGGPDQAPTAKRPREAGEGHARAVHPFVVVQLPRTGDQVGQIPDTPAGRLLYGWLAAFNGKDPQTLRAWLPTEGAEAAQAAEVELQKATGGFTLVAAREVAPGVIVFRMHDQTKEQNEVLGTLRMNDTGSPAGIRSLNLRAVSEVSDPQQ